MNMPCNVMVNVNPLLQLYNHVNFGFNFSPVQHGHCGVHGRFVLPSAAVEGNRDREYAVMALPVISDARKVELWNT